MFFEVGTQDTVEEKGLPWEIDGLGSPKASVSLFRNSLKEGVMIFALPVTYDCDDRMT